MSCRQFYNTLFTKPIDLASYVCYNRKGGERVLTSAQISPRFEVGIGPEIHPHTNWCLAVVPESKKRQGNPHTVTSQWATSNLTTQT